MYKITGFSFSNDESGYVTNETQVGSDLYSAIAQFYQLFPNLRSNDFYITGESNMIREQK
jgi:vitellogenic carboxypeptidase-like protein